MIESSVRRVMAVGHGYERYDTERELLAPYGVDQIEIVSPHDKDFLATVSEADAILVRETPIKRDVIEELKHCRIIVRYGVGVDNIDLEAARQKDIFVANIPNYGVDEVSEHALTLFLTVARRIVKRDRDVRAGAWNIGQKEKIFRIAGRRLGLVGFGRIAQALHSKLSGMAMQETLVYDPYLSAPLAGVKQVDLPTLCREADVVSVHAPLTPDTHHLIGEEMIRLMKPTTILINTARGGLVDTNALLRALQERRIFGAGLDVFEREPLPEGHPLVTLDNVVLTDHTAWYSEASVKELQSKAAAEIARVFNGKTPQAWVNKGAP